jgi:hypothetical protein
MERRAGHCRLLPGPRNPEPGRRPLADTGILGDDDNWTETHYRLGLVLLILGILQAAYG